MVRKFSFLLICLGLCVAMVVSCGSSTSSTQNDIGKTLFEQKCALCHGVNGEKQLSGAMKLSESKSSVEEIIELVTNGRKQMTPFKGRLTPEEIKAVSEYALTFQTK